MDTIMRLTPVMISIIEWQEPEFYLVVTNGKEDPSKGLTP